MFQNIIQLFKLFQFRYHTGLALDNNLEFVDDVGPIKNKSINVVSKLNTSVLKCFRNVTKKTQIYTNSIARVLCQIMTLAYEDETTIVQQLPQYSQLVYHADGAIVVYFKDYNLAVLSFAGTKVESLKDWWTNITGTYKKEWKKQQSQISDILNKFTDSYIVVCGHSKGGIMSILAYNDTNLLIDACYVAGVPDYFVTSNKSVGIYSIKNKRDPVANVLGSENAHWEVLLGDIGKPSIKAHQISTYIDILS
jgi:hypothetical protein